MGSVWRKGWGPQSGGNFKSVLVTARWWVYEQGGEYTCRATWLQDILSSDLINNRDHSSKKLPKLLQKWLPKSTKLRPILRVVHCTSMVAHLIVRPRPSRSPTISTSVYSSSPRSRNAVMPPNALVRSLVRHQEIDTMIDKQSSQPEFTRSPRIPHTIHLYDLDAMPIPGSSSTVHTGRHHCRLLLPWSNRNGPRGYWRVHLGKQFVTAATTY